jgi:hypothetical protein
VTPCWSEDVARRVQSQLRPSWNASVRNKTLCQRILLRSSNARTTRVRRLDQHCRNTGASSERARGEILSTSFAMHPLLLDSCPRHHGGNKGEEARWRHQPEIALGFINTVADLLCRPANLKSHLVSSNTVAITCRLLRTLHSLAAEVSHLLDPVGAVSLRCCPLPPSYNLIVVGSTTGDHFAPCRSSEVTEWPSSGDSICE